MTMRLITGLHGEVFVTADDDRAFNTGIYGSGDVVLDTGNKFAASIQSANLVRVLDGDACIQGCAVRQLVNVYQDLAIDNGAQGYSRNDLIIIRYTKNAGTGVETAALAVVKGTASATTPVDPTLTTGVLRTGSLVHEMPLWRVVITNVTPATPVRMYTPAQNTLGMNNSVFGARMSADITPSAVVEPIPFAIVMDSDHSINNDYAQLLSNKVKIKKKGAYLVNLQIYASAGFNSGEYYCKISTDVSSTMEVKADFPATAINGLHQCWMNVSAIMVLDVNEQISTKVQPPGAGSYRIDYLLTYITVVPIAYLS